MSTQTLYWIAPIVADSFIQQYPCANSSRCHVSVHGPLACSRTLAPVYTHRVSGIGHNDMDCG